MSPVGFTKAPTDQAIGLYLYPANTATQLNLTGLHAGTYQVRVRGEHSGQIVILT